MEFFIIIIVIAVLILVVTCSMPKTSQEKSDVSYTPSLKPIMIFDEDEKEFYSKYSQEAKNVVLYTKDIIVNTGDRFLREDTFLLALSIQKDTIPAQVLNSFGCDFETMLKVYIENLASYIKKYQFSEPYIPFTPDMGVILKHSAHKIAQEFNSDCVKPEHIFIALLKIENKNLDNILNALGLDKQICLSKTIELIKS